MNECFVNIRELSQLFALTRGISETRRNDSIFPFSQKENHLRLDYTLSDARVPRHVLQFSYTLIGTNHAGSPVERVLLYLFVFMFALPA